MTADVEGLGDAIDRATAAGSTQGYLQRLAERVGAQATASAVFGMPVQQGAVTVIPVAKTRFLFGGGSGRSEGGKDEGAGGGGGGTSAPVGFIEIREGRAQFVGITDPAGVWPVVLAGGVAAWLALKGLRTLLRAR